MRNIQIRFSLLTLVWKIKNVGCCWKNGKINGFPALCSLENKWGQKQISSASRGENLIKMVGHLNTRMRKSYGNGNCRSEFGRTETKITDRKAIARQLLSAEQMTEIRDHQMAFR